MIVVYRRYAFAERRLTQLDLNYALSAALVANLNQSIIGASRMGNAPVV